MWHITQHHEQPVCPTSGGCKKGGTLRWHADVGPLLYTIDGGASSSSCFGGWYNMLLRESFLGKTLSLGTLGLASWQEDHHLIPLEEALG